MAIKYKWLIEQLREIISDSIQKGINKLPTEQELAVRYRVSRQTVRAALAVLEDEREIRRIKGSGAYITGLSSLEDRNIVGILIPDEQQYEYPALINGRNHTEKHNVQETLFPHSKRSVHKLCRIFRNQAYHNIYRNTLIYELLYHVAYHT